MNSQCLCSSRDFVLNLFRSPVFPVFDLKPTCTISAFYKGESQGKKFPGDWKERRGSLCVPAHVMLRGSGGFLSLEIHFVSVTTLSASDANKQCSCEVPTMVLSETRGL